MKVYFFFIIFFFIISCSSNKGVYWCGDHACADKKEKEAYFKKTMIVEVRNLDKNTSKSESVNEKIINQSVSKEEKVSVYEDEFNNEVSSVDEEEIERQIELQEEERIMNEKKLNEKIEEEKEEKQLSVNEIEEQKPSTVDKVVEVNQSSSKNFDEILEEILDRNNSRSYPKINDIPK